MTDSPTYDLDFHFDPMCPFAWQTSRWVTRVVDAAGISVNWRFISLKFLNEDKPPSPFSEGAEQSHRYLRVLAAIRDAEGPGRMWDLYTAWGQRLWYEPLGSEGPAALAHRVDMAEILREHGLEAFAAAADDEAWDEVIRAETNDALDRTGPDVGTPILTFWPSGNSYFGPVISSLPDSDTSVKIYEALRTLVDFDTFSELKRTARPPLDLPVFAA